MSIRNDEQGETFWQVDKESIKKLRIPPEEMNYILVTDVGSTTTKSRFFKNIEGA